MSKVKRRKKLPAIHCNGGNRAQAKVDRTALQGGCAAAIENHPEGVLMCASGCVGFGDCVNSCRLKAIHMGEHGVPEVMREKCVGCGLCAKTCPQHIIEMQPEELCIVVRCSNKDGAKTAKEICELSCIACRICEKNCPVAAIQVIDNIAIIDPNICVACGMCAVKCPRGAILDEDGIFTVAR